MGSLFNNSQLHCIQERYHPYYYIVASDDIFLASAVAVALTHHLERFALATAYLGAAYYWQRSLTTQSVARVPTQAPYYFL